MKKGKFILLTREEFGDWLLASRITRDIKIIQNHHTWVPNYSHFKGDNHFDLLESMDRSHIKRRLGGIAQNITTFNDGLIAVCRPLNQMPAGIANKNYGAICIENLGNFDIGQDEMTQEQKETIIFVNAILCYKFNLMPSIDSIVYHNWFAPKTCPGTNFFGGNSIDDADAKFIPLVVGELDKIKNVRIKTKKETNQRFVSGKSGMKVRE